VIVGTSAFFYFRNWSEERAIDHFVTLLKQQKYQDAYQLWQISGYRQVLSTREIRRRLGRPPAYTRMQAPCRSRIVDSCEAGVVFEMAYPGADEFGLWVERKTKIISFYPWPRCAGRHLQIWSSS